MVKVSLIVPVYNTEMFLKKCLESIISQTLKEIEIIIVNDGSTDNSQKIIDDFSKKDSRIKAFYKENEGLSSARNLGLEKAKGKYIWFIDSDDYIMKPYACEKLYNFSEENNLDIAVCNYVQESSKRKRNYYAKIRKASI